MPGQNTNPSQSAPLDRHRSLLEEIIDFSVETRLEDGQRARANRQFYQVLDHFHKLEPEPKRHQRGTTYSRPILIRYTYEYARSQESRDAFFRSMGLSLDADDGSREYDGRFGRRTGRRSPLGVLRLRRLSIR